MEFICCPRSRLIVHQLCHGKCEKQAAQSWQLKLLFGHDDTELTAGCCCSEQLRFSVFSPAEIVNNAEISVYSSTLYEVALAVSCYVYVSLQPSILLRSSGTPEIITNSLAGSAETNTQSSDQRRAG